MIAMWYEVNINLPYPVKLSLYLYLESGWVSFPWEDKYSSGGRSHRLIVHRYANLPNSHTFL